MSQNSERLSWTFEEVDSKLKGIMVNICHNMADAAKRYGHEGNYVIGANIAGFEKVVKRHGGAGHRLGRCEIETVKNGAAAPFFCYNGSGTRAGTAGAARSFSEKKALKKNVKKVLTFVLPHNCIIAKRVAKKAACNTQDMGS